MEERDDEKHQDSKPTLGRRWRQQTWKRRFAIYCGSFVLLIALFYVVENTRGTMALNAAKQRAADAGVELDFAKLMMEEAVPDEENYAMCLPTTERIGTFTDLHPDFNGTHPHHDHLSTRPRYTGQDYALPDDFSVKFNPRKKSHEEGCREVLRLLSGWDSELDEISEASRRDHCVFDVDWAGPVDQITVPTDHQTARIFRLRAEARLGIGENKGAVSDLKTIILMGNHFDEKPVLLNLLVCSVRVRILSGIIWEGVNRRQFDEEDLKQLAENLDLIQPDNVWTKSSVSEGPFAIAACKPFIRGASSRFSKSKETLYRVSYFNSDPLPNHSFDDDVIAFANRLIFASVPTGWFRQNLAEKIDADVDLFQHQGSLKQEFSFLVINNFKTSKYDFIYGGSMTSDAYSSMLARFIGAAAYLELAKTAIAFERHYLKHGNYPSTFEALVPEFLDTAPIDPWTDKPMLLDFRPDGRPVIYSVGKDLDDDGGIPQTRSKPRNGDVVWHYSLPPGFDAKAHYEK